MSVRVRIIKRDGYWFAEVYKGTKRSWFGFGAEQEVWYSLCGLKDVPIPFASRESAEATIKRAVTAPSEPDGTVQYFVIDGGTT